MQLLHELYTNEMSKKENTVLQSTCSLVDMRTLTNCAFQWLFSQTIPAGGLQRRCSFPSKGALLSAQRIPTVSLQDLGSKNRIYNVQCFFYVSKVTVIYLAHCSETLINICKVCSFFWVSRLQTIFFFSISILFLIQNIKQCTCH